ncbi:MAG: sulfite exporter TauE/SafE family protein [Myxococcales bacterium]|nr:sulfite exporter TauE/SafE family protein [Myxococcales bacterium]
MPLEHVALVSTALFLASALYATVGHGGASAYLAILALTGEINSSARPTVLAMNVVVASIAAFHFTRVGAFSPRLFLPLATTSVPLAYLGGRLSPSESLFRDALGVALVVAALRSFMDSTTDEGELEVPSVPLLATAGGCLGFASGLVGVGGGIFLSPLLLLRRWADARSVSGVAAVFIVVNSLAGLAGALQSGGKLHAALPLWLASVVIGGWLGAAHGSRHLDRRGLRQVLSVVLVMAAAKMFLT